ncbi:glycosyl hydrolase family 38 protein (macronuclear) [Tetrahymena thermophila SB210]|uniref:Glycosyl hydrolase family 38 protein n=1 Tax=Tetrahymena thermophila (strain SB210) TaxID=312017 RepID=W7X822_TETTS|nr:glycosyl hydrolase family 38 protein [Tetrahymena thermophila SB210]EWS72573.1 glycosyl hydrolase family 38 protein [Tetrahymena thermophila SB210]|eukprot:XP_012654856.1 glycosyl hydrolase family 38 protein [Tetrahymena thermophila SB210]
MAQNFTLSTQQKQKQVVQKRNGIVVVQLDGTKTATQQRFSSSYLQKQVREVETFIHSINANDGVGKEIVMLVNTILKRDGNFLTEFQQIRIIIKINRLQNKWDLKQTQHVSGNYYPICSIIGSVYQKDKQRVLAVNDSSQEMMEEVYQRGLNKFDDIKPQQGLQQKVRNQIIFENEKESTGRQIQNHLDSANQILVLMINQNLLQLPENFINLFETLSLISNYYLNLMIYLKQFPDYFTLRLNNIYDYENVQFIRFQIKNLRRVGVA